MLDAPLRALVLAAGESRRFGGGKLHALYQHRPLLSHVLTVVEAACSQNLLQGGHVVVAEGDGRGLSLIRAAGLEPVVNRAPSLGLSHSLRLGLESLDREMAGEAGAALIFLGDQPLVRLDVIEQLAEAWSQGRGTMVRPRYRSQGDAPGHPVLVSRRMWPRARHLEGDSGFGALLSSSSPGCLTIDVAGYNPDVDTQADLQALEKAHT